jgi:AraC-like DNA-binding protein
MNDLGTISGAALNQYLASAQAHGLDPLPGLKQAGISQQDAHDPESRIPGEAFEALLVWLINNSRDPLFGLHTSEFVQPGSYSVMGYIAMSAATIREALERVTRYEKLVGDMGTTETVLADGQVQVRWHCRHNLQPARRHLIENVLGSWVRYTRWLANDQQLSPSAVWLEHDGPGPALVAEYERVFRCPVLFGQPFSALVTAPALLEHRLRQPDPTLLSALEQHAAQKLDELGIDTSLAHRVRECIQSRLGSRLPRKEEIAEELGMNARTLHRRLREEGTTWQDVLDELRRALAAELLRDTDLNQASIAERLGYSDIRSFQRSFKRQHGMTPGAYRRQAGSQ